MTKSWAHQLRSYASVCLFACGVSNCIIWLGMPVDERRCYLSHQTLLFRSFSTSQHWAQQEKHYRSFRKELYSVCWIICFDLNIKYWCLWIATTKKGAVEICTGTFTIWNLFNFILTKSKFGVNRSSLTRKVENFKMSQKERHQCFPSQGYVDCEFKIKMRKMDNAVKIILQNYRDVEDQLKIFKRHNQNFQIVPEDIVTGSHYIVHDRIVRRATKRINITHVFIARKFAFLLK